ncbi:hypothetical protein THAOC_26695 [Thalassiosira oceanica]|uniref:Peptidase M14 domain-containing protein n=1 Tax=Thalassiosira oceanica TaxID=159749 RepID=K0RJD0_THAOC|nr:hypothetical protein THAOC_26695 [Thalassiosira oceanica]|eukprot:EJK53793.1 hypothetical protein THAOC_26695 [Thalassiosira oceanica]
MRRKIEDTDQTPDLLHGQEADPFDPTLKTKGHVSTTPTVIEVDWYLNKHLGITAADLGNETMSLQGRIIKFYTTCDGPAIAERPTILFLSLVHGNEVMGLLALLQTARLIMLDKPAEYENQAPCLIFMPFVNIDAYTLNVESLKSGGPACRRTNLRETFDCDDGFSRDNPASCEPRAVGGVDLNRNHPFDWEKPPGFYLNEWENMADCYQECGSTYHGKEPWSEPESRAVRNVVLRYNVTAAISFHSRHNMLQRPLLIHPYTSLRSFRSMPLEDRQRFRDWSRKMNRDGYYVTGTAYEAIEYTAGGSTIDWMYSLGIAAFVIETVPPCGDRQSTDMDRWCVDIDDEKIWKEMLRHGEAGEELAKLASASSSSTSMPSFAPTTTQPTDDWSAWDPSDCYGWDCDTQDRSASIVYVLLALIVTIGLPCILCILLKSLQSEQRANYTSPPEQNDLELEEEDNQQEEQIELGTIT